jgi:hypothetical protein
LLFLLLLNEEFLGGFGLDGLFELPELDAAMSFEFSLDEA